MKYFDMLEISVATINFSYLDTVYDHEGLILDFGKFTQDNSYWGATLRDYSSLFGGEIINTFAMTGGRPTDALDWGTYLDGAGSTGTLDISIFLFPEGTKQITLSGTEYDFETVSWSEYEITQLVAVLEEMESYINVNFVTAADEDSANFVFALTDNLNLPGSALMLAPGAGSDPGFGIFDRSVNSWDTDGSGGLEIGGFSYRTLVHEIGHGLGLAHPHDSGGDSTIMNGVDDEDDTGDFQLNQGVFTAMGYVEGWDSAPYGPTNSTNYGDQGTFGTLDVAVLQAAYGANTSTGVGASTYTLSGSNQVGTHYRTIFDNGGADVFNYSGSRDAVFDLRAATLEYEDGGGGYVSHVDGIHGGFTIANGTVIENAVGGSGDDSFTGNAIGNYLSGNGGNDTFIGGAGSDLFEGGTGLDTVDFTDRIGIDWDINLDSNVGVARASGASSENDSLISIENVTLSDGDDIVELTFADNIIRGGGGTDRVVFSGASSDYTFSNTGQIDGIMISGEGNDTFYAVEEFEFSDGVFAWNNLPAEADMRPDLTIENVTLLNSTITQGMDATIFYDVVENNGFDAGRTNTGLYISTTPNFANAILLEEDSVIVNANERDAESELLNAIFSYDAGIYYLFVVADNDGVPNNETNENNNVSSPIVLTIEAASDYDFSFVSVSLDDTTIQEGSTTTINYAVQNSGTTASTNAVIQGFYASVDAIYGNSDDVYLNSDGAGILSGGEVHNDSDVLTGLSSLSAGTYNIFAVADYENVMGDETNENNNVSSPIVLTIEAASDYDFSFVSVSLDDTTIQEGSTTTINYAVQNSGTTTSTNAVIQGFYASVDAIYGNSDDVYLNSDGAGILSGGEVHNDSDVLTGLSSLNAGTYNIFAVADYENVMGDETNENNNVSSPIVLTIELNNSGDINGTTGNDTLAGTNDNDVINGLAGNDILYGLGGDDSLNGGAGADRLTGGAGADMLIGGIGFDSVDYRSATSSVRFNVDSGGTLGDALGDTFSGIERYYLSDLSDIITGSSANEFFYGGGGNDQINGGGGIDRIYGGDGNDVQRGQDGNDLLFGSMGNDQLNGGAGFDIATYRTSTSRVVLNLGSGGTFGDAAGDTYFGVEAVYGSDFGDILAGNSSANELRGWDGDDILNGGGGNDRLFGGAGADALNGGLGIDIAVYTDASSRVTVNLVTLGSVGDAAGDSYSSVEWVWGSSFDDIITGDAKNNRLEGRSGNDTLIGGDGNDRLMGGDGNDTINGGNGVDTIYGQSGNDTLIGAGGNDFFFGSDGGDVIHGGLDFDTISYLASSSGVGVNLQSGGFSGEASGDTYSSIERVFGSSHEDHIVGSNEANTILGNGGHDYLEGGLGNDSLFGGAGIDSFGYNTTNGDNDVINDFSNSNEVIYFIGGDANFDTFTELQAMGTDSGGNVIFDFGGGNTLTVVGQNLADLSESNFVFNIEDPLIEVALFYMDSLI